MKLDSGDGRQRAGKHRTPDLSYIPGMLSPREKQHLFDLTSDYYEAQGDIVEIGSWLGSSAAYLAAGVKESGKQGSVYCYDRFRANDEEIKKAERHGFHLEEGQDTLPIFVRHLKDIHTAVYPIRTDLDNIQWRGGPIEILHIDAPKKFDPFMRVMELFGPYLIPGRSIVVLQDFVYPGAYPIPLIMSQMRDAFDLFYIPDVLKPTVSFYYKRKAEFGNGFKLKKMREEDVVTCWGKMAKQLSESQRAYFNLGLARYFFDKGEFDKALKIAAENIDEMSFDRINSLKANSAQLWRWFTGNSAYRRNLQCKCYIRNLLKSLRIRA